MEATVSFRGHGGGVEGCSWASVATASLQTAHPWRTFRWCRDQKHYSGTYWSATMRDLVIYESHLELSRLLLDDFDRAVHRILAQPFLLKTQVNGKVKFPHLFADAVVQELDALHSRHLLVSPAGRRTTT
ncbi:hypothetical protein P6B95_08700 [Streptomyces atratus]|uniref:hypothetical protein n=1 Tax=Streptomyces atratus TaxID=1893 RepID=UPI00199D2B7D|nr:hypothetical protein [Streptomyces atratus]WPW27452.1 hypothetical protein P6B95_08700 [Streptomyces atratus]GGT69751.1 hypothetical protein GCM10010207_80240 [Streptomyces atratus]